MSSSGPQPEHLRKYYFFINYFSLFLLDFVIRTLYWCLGYVCRVTTPAYGTDEGCQRWRSEVCACDLPPGWQLHVYVSASSSAQWRCWHVSKGPHRKDYSVASAISVYLYQSTAERNRNKKWRVLRTFHFPIKTQLHFFAPGFHEALLHSSKRAPFLFTLSQVSFSEPATTGAWLMQMKEASKVTTANDPKDWGWADEHGAGQHLDLMWR